MIVRMEFSVFNKRKSVEMAWNPEIEAAFYPKSIAVIGASAEAKREGPRVGGGSGFITSLESTGFKGRIYPVNPRADEIYGYKAYPTVSSISEHIDLVIMSIPAYAAPEALLDCARADAKNIHMFTAGFEETGDVKAIELGKRVREIALENGLNIIGPNCMGLYVPESGIGTFPNLPKKVGPVAFISQSGGHLNWYSHYGPNYGVYFSKGISFGNAYVLDSTDFLEYFENDKQTRMICMYLEGVKNGVKLRKQVQALNRKKPVIIWKAGLTEAGTKAVASHTGSLAGQEAVWKGFFAQTGAVQVNSLEEMAEAAMTFLCLKHVKGKRAAIVSIGGGTSVSAADTCSREGLETPALSTEAQNELKKFIPVAGSSVRNPLDTVSGLRDITILERELEIVIAEPNIDMLILMPHLDGARNGLDKTVDFLVDFAKNHPSGKPVVIVFHSFANDPWEAEQRARLKVELPNKGVAVYSSLTAASRALARFARYHQIQKDIKR